MKTKDKNSVAGTAVDAKHPCILIYDDDREILLLCNTILAQSQYRVETLVLCDNVIKDIARTKPDIILMDLWVPEIGGEKAITIIKTNQATQYIPVIVFSVNAEIEEICEKTKADGYIKKPFDITNFKETIKKNILKTKSYTPV